MQFSYTRKTAQLLKALNFSYFEELIFGQESTWKFSVLKKAIKKVSLSQNWA